LKSEHISATARSRGPRKSAPLLQQLEYQAEQPQKHNAMRENNLCGKQIKQEIPHKDKDIYLPLLDSAARPTSEHRDSNR
jgi:hypothetical protein